LIPLLLRYLIPERRFRYRYIKYKTRLAKITNKIIDMAQCKKKVAGSILIMGSVIGSKIQ